MAITFLCVAGGTAAALLLTTGVLHLLPRLGRAGCAASEALCRAPWLDALITWLTIVPLVVGPVAAGWLGLLGAVVGQVAAMLVWIALHELAHRRARRGPRIVKVLNRLVGPWRNHAALWIMTPAAPLFWLVRVTQMLIYPPLTRLVGLPRYDVGEWVNVSRHKFDGLVGHDLIWCLYCDWMTGLWSLGSEMLRNIESLWCPIRFAEGKKCENCRIDFPDLAPSSPADRERLREVVSGDGGAVSGNGWVAADGDMADAAALLERQYAGAAPRGWFGHPARLTIGGRWVSTTSSAASADPEVGRTPSRGDGGADEL